MRKFIISTLISLFIPTCIVAQPILDELFSVKETFRYEVKYSIFKLGEVEVSLLPDTMYNGKLHKHLLTVITSNPKVPFVGDEEDHFHSFFYENDDGLPVTSYYWKDNIDENLYKEIEYTFDREKNLVYYKEEDDSRDTLNLQEPATAGHIIFYFSRLFAGKDTMNTMPVYVTKKEGAIHFSNNTEIEKRNYAAFEEPIEAVLTRGSTENIAGPFGFSGDFRAWYLNNDLRVPLEARLRILFGNAMVRLIEYKREEL